MDKPILYIDVDGVLFGQYGGYSGPQLRPGVVEFLNWATEQFECKWLTQHSPQRLEQLSLCLNAHDLFKKIRYVEYSWWNEQLGEKEKVINMDADFYWIEDDPLSMHPRLNGLVDDYGCSRYIEVSPYGEGALQKAKLALSVRLLARGYMKDAII